MRYYFLMILVASIHYASAQKLPAIQADRPDQTESPATVQKKYFQGELGFEYDRNDEGEYSFLLPTFLFKYGISNRTELRLVTEIEKERSPEGINTGLNPVIIGFKTNFVKKKGIIPEIAFLGHLVIPDVAGRKKRNNFYAPGFRFSMENTISPKIDLGYNLGIEWDGLSRKPTYIYTLTTGISLTEKVSSFIEFYGFIAHQLKADNRIDAGFGFLVNNNVMIDLAAGAGLSPNTPLFFCTSGISFRFK